MWESVCSSFFFQVGHEIAQQLELRRLLMNAMGMLRLEAERVFSQICKALAINI